MNMSKFKTIKKYNQNFKNYNFSEDTPVAELEFLEMTIDFDTEGRVVSEIKFTEDGEMEEQNDYRYDANGKLIEHELYYALDEAREKVVLVRDEKGKLVSETKMYGDEKGAHVEFEYDSKDRVVAIVNYDDDGDFSSRETIEYNDAGGIVKRSTLGIDNKIVSEIKFVYLSDKQVEETHYDEKGKMGNLTVTTFDDKGKEVNSVERNAQGKLISSMLNIFDDRGNVIEKIYKDFHSKKVKNEYDEKDQLILQEIFDTNGLLVKRNTYDYDEAGNIISEQNFEMDSSRGGRDRHFGTRYEYIS